MNKSHIFHPITGQALYYLAVGHYHARMIELVKEGDKVAVLSDILGDEDHIGDMDFKVAGTQEGITAVQMDIKGPGLTRELLRQVLRQAKEGRLHILKKMRETIPEPRKDLSRHAPRIITLQVKPDKIRDIIGPGGKNIRSIVDQTGVDRNRGSGSGQNRIAQS